MENTQKKITEYSDIEIIEMAMLEQFAKHHLGGDGDAAKNALNSTKNVMERKNQGGLE